MSTVIKKDIFYGLPTFPSTSGKKFTAVVTGGNGITGQHLVRVLNESPERWESIYALSRRPPQNALQSDIVKYLSVDFLQSPEEIVKNLEGLNNM
jgi:NAD dependent epimerase/dehydratase family enzyme